MLNISMLQVFTGCPYYVVIMYVFIWELNIIDLLPVLYSSVEVVLFSVGGQYVWINSMLLLGMHNLQS